MRWEGREAESQAVLWDSISHSWLDESVAVVAGVLLAVRRVEVADSRS